MTYSEFWNIAGRAGRAMRDRLGMVVFPVNNDRRLDDVRKFLAGEAEELASALLSAIKDIGDSDKLDLGFVRNHKTLSVFLQYLTHALRVAGRDLDVGTEVEDLLRSSLVYHQARSHDTAVAERLIRLARRYFAKEGGRDRGYLSLADGTGFSLYTVDMMYASHRNEYPQFASSDFWQSESLFARDGHNLASVIEVLSNVPELNLGTENRGTFNAQRIAGIVKSWVTGAPITQIAEEHFSNVESDPKKRQRLASHYVHSRLVGQIPWGIGALQRLTLPEGSLTASNSISSMVFYGVPSVEAATLRMAGVPRVAAEGLANQLRRGSQTVDSFPELRGWVAGRSTEDWSSALPASSPINGQQAQLVWRELAGVQAVLVT